MRLSVGPFGIKDLFTLVNLLGGVFAVRFIWEGNLELAGMALLAGYLLGDAVDGYVARLTRTSNQFGGEFDTATDHFVQAIVPAIIIFAVYARAGHATAGVVLMAIVVGCATIRQALFTVARLGDPLMYCGLPRTVSGLASMALVLSRVFFRENPWAIATGAVVITALSVMGLLPIPYMTHKGARRMQLHVRIAVVLFLVTTPAAFFVARDYAFDVLFFWTFGYAAAAWIPLHADERRSFFERYRVWTKEIKRT